uniref:GDP-mannose transporter n=1 Tax=Solanum tuberosum TaxID=4113 RepID=M1D394_SOLTU
MNPRSLPVAASLDAPDPVLERVLIEDTKNSSHGGERNFLAHQPILLDQVSKSFRGEVVSRSFSMKAANRNDENLENGMLENDIEKSVRSNKVVTVHNKALLSGVAYCISSCSMILVNKYVLSSYGFNAGISLMVYQNFVSVVVVSSLRVFGIITTEPLTWRLVRVWLPVNVIFVGMLITSMFR